MAPAGQILASCWRKHANANLAIALSCLALIGIIWAWTLDRVAFERAETVAGAVRHNENLALAFEEHTIRTFRGVEQTISFVKSQFLEQGLRLALRGMIENGRLDAGLLTGIGVADERGNLVLGTMKFERGNVADHEFFSAHRQNNAKGMFISKPVLGPSSRKWVVPMSQRFDKPDGSFGGIVFASVDAAYFAGFYHKADLGQHGAVSLVGLDGIARAVRIGRKEAFGDDMRGTRIFQELVKKRRGSLVGGGRLDGVVRFLSFRTLAQYPLIVTVGTSQAEVMASFSERKRRYYLTAGFASAVTLAIAAFIMTALSRRRRAEQAVLEQFKLAEAFFNHSVSCLVVLDRDFNFMRVNAAYAEACRRDISEFAGRNHFDMYPSDAKAIFEDVVRAREPFVTFERGFVFPDQPERGVTYWDWTLVPVLDGQRDVEYLVLSLNEVTERKHAQEELKQSIQRVHALSERVMKVQQDEREGIARELHDELGQTLAALKVNLQMLEPYCARGEAEGHLTEALMMTGRSLDQVRGMILDLRPPGLEELGVAMVLESHVAKQAQAAGWNARFETTLPGRLPPELEMACFRVAQEALTNVMRHAKAKQVRVALALDAAEVQLSVRDDGVGFDVTRVPEPSLTGGFGLIGMRERVRQMGGRLAIDSAPGRGTAVRASFPFEPSGDRKSDANASVRA